MQKGSVVAVEIRKITKYIVKDKEFDTEEKAVADVENRIEHIMRDIFYQCAPINARDHIKIMDGMLKRRTELAELLAYGFTDESDA